MNTLMKAAKYSHIMYYAIALLTYVELFIIMFAPEYQTGIAGTGFVLGIIFGAISTFLRINEKSSVKVIINIAIVLGVLIIVFCVPGV